MSYDSADDPENSTPQRILAATAEVLSRNGVTKLSLSEVAAQAGVSRPTLYRWFASKEELISAFSRYERQTFDSGLTRATAGLTGLDKLDAALRFIVDYQYSSTGVRMIDIEPRQVLNDCSRSIPPMREGLQRMIPGPDAAVKAAAAIRIAISHYVVRSDDGRRFPRPAATGGGHQRLDLGILVVVFGVEQFVGVVVVVGSGIGLIPGGLACRKSRCVGPRGRRRCSRREPAR